MSPRKWSRIRPPNKWMKVTHSFTLVCKVYCDVFWRIIRPRKITLLFSALLRHLEAKLNQRHNSIQMNRYLLPLSLILRITVIFRGCCYYASSKGKYGDYSPDFYIYFLTFFSWTSFLVPVSSILIFLCEQSFFFSFEMRFFPAPPPLLPRQKIE